MSDEFDATVTQIRKRVDPEPDERERLQAVVDDLTAEIEDAITGLPVEADIVQVGSTARGTWLAGDRDIDLFVQFPADLPRAELEEYGLQIGRQIFPDGREEYAEHPYVVGEREGFDVDLVPCYAVADATQIQSAVDRTPFHTEYLDEHLSEDLAGDVRVCKQFLTGIGAYGSDLRTRGFSGYLTELLVLEYGGFRPFVEAVADWHPPVKFDPEDHREASFDDPLVVIDPTDPERNVAAVCSETNVARLQHYARDLLADPRVELFVPNEREPLDPETVEAAFEDRETTPVALTFETPDLVEDDLYPQLRKSLDGITNLLDREGFGVLRSDLFADDERAVLLAELEVLRRPAVARHEGPPVHVRQHAEGFFERYETDETVTGPFIEADRYVVEREREHTTAQKLLDSDAVFEVALGTHVESAMAADYEVLDGAEVAALADRFGVELAQYLDPRP
mgnify:CR=1 FL=1